MKNTNYWNMVYAKHLLVSKIHRKMLKTIVILYCRKQMYQQSIFTTFENDQVVYQGFYQNSLHTKFFGHCNWLKVGFKVLFCIILERDWKQSNTHRKTGVYFYLLESSDEAAIFYFTICLPDYKATLWDANQYKANNSRKRQHPKNMQLPTYHWELIKAINVCRYNHS